MEPEPSVLTVELLEELRSRWSAQRAPIAQYLRPGLSDEEIDEHTAPLELVVPPEARVWWRWHDGATPGIRPIAGEMVGRGWWYAPLAEAVKMTHGDRRAAHEVYTEPHAHWCRSWLVLSWDGHGGRIAVDCADTAAPTSSVYRIDSLDDPHRFVPRTRSIGEMVTWWIDSIDDGASGYDATVGRWRYDWERLPRERRETGLI